VKQYLPSVGGIVLAFSVTGIFQAIHQFHRGVMAQRQAICQLADGRLGAGRQSLDRQQCLMLLRLYAVLSGPDFAELKEVTELVAELSQLLIVA
jgi:hypothetical protein